MQARLLLWGIVWILLAACHGKKGGRSANPTPQQPTCEKNTQGSMDPACKPSGPDAPGEPAGTCANGQTLAEGSCPSSHPAQQTCELTLAGVIPDTCPALPELPAPEGSLFLDNVTVAELRDSSCRYHCAGLLLNSNSVLMPASCLKTPELKKAEQSVFLRIEGKNYRLSGSQCLPHRFTLNKKGQPQNLLGGIPMAVLTIEGQVQGVKSPVDPTRSEEENMKHVFGDPLVPGTTLLTMSWSGSRVFASTAPYPTLLASSGPQIVFARGKLQEQCNYARSLGLWVNDASVSFLIGLPLYPLTSLEKCLPLHGELYFRIDHVLSREALSVQLQRGTAHAKP